MLTYTMLVTSIAQIRTVLVIIPARTLVALWKANAALSSVLVVITHGRNRTLSFIVLGFGVMKATEIFVAHQCPNAMLCIQYPKVMSLRRMLIKSHVRLGTAQ
jgi:hypothetical protein